MSIYISTTVRTCYSVMRISYKFNEMSKFIQQLNCQYYHDNNHYLGPINEVVEVLNLQRKVLS